MISQHQADQASASCDRILATIELIQRDLAKLKEQTQEDIARVERELETP